MLHAESIINDNMMFINSIAPTEAGPKNIFNETAVFKADVLRGLHANPKRLDSRYFYDEKGDRIFQEIMKCPEYYLTKCETEILENQSEEIVKTLIPDTGIFDMVELGAGDATKSVYLLNELLIKKVVFTYLPIDISANMIQYLQISLPKALPGLVMLGLNGDYLDMLQRINTFSDKPRVVLLLGANIGNMSIYDAEIFCNDLRNYLVPGDKILIGFDLKKNPSTILAAYSDREGITKRFNINLLDRINSELHADFITDRFGHYASYDPETGACRSYLISLQEQVVKIGEELIFFENNEYIDMEISQKYRPDDIAGLASRTGYRTVRHFFDSKLWFVDTIWEAC